MRVMPDTRPGRRWVLESPDEHWLSHDARQVEFWRSRPAAERLAQATWYRERVFGALTGYPPPRSWRLVPPGTGE